MQVVTQMEAGGAQRVALLLAGELVARGHDVETWFLYLKRPAHVGEPRIRVLLPHPPGGADYLRIFGRLVRALRERDPEILITHTHYANVLGQVAGRLAGVPRRIAVQQNPVSSFPRLARWADYILGSVGVYSAVVAVSDAVLGSAATYPAPYRRRMRRIPNSVPPVEVKSNRSSVRILRELPGGTPVLGCLGRLATQKNHELLLRALAALPEVHVVIVGEGELRPYLEQLAVRLKVEHRLHLPGELEWEEAMSIISACDVFVMPSLYEGLSLALLEAMHLGLPIVASDIPSIRETLGDAGLVVSPGSPERLAAVIREVLESPDLAFQLRGRSRARARAFSVQVMADAYERLFH